MMNATFDRAAVDDLVIYHAAVPDLRRRGKRLVGHCPLHCERTPSFSVDPNKGLFYCFGCGAGGDALTLTMLLHKTDFVGAAKRLGAWKHVSLAERTRLWRERQRAAKARQLREYYVAREREVFLELRHMCLLLESIVRHSVKLLDRVDEQTANSLRESISLTSELIRKFSAGFTLVGFGPAVARRDYVLHPERRHQWHEKVLDRWIVHDDHGRAREVII